MNFDPALREELIRIIEDVEILSPSVFTFAGIASSGVAIPMMGLLLTPEMPPLATELTSQLYQNCYTNRFRGRIVPNERPPAIADREWVEALSRANQSQERWEDGWLVIHATPTGKLVARRGETTRTLVPGEFVNLSGSGMVLPPGTEVRAFIPRESRTLQPGYYFAFGETSSDAGDEFSLVRFYLNVSVEGAADLLELLSAHLNRWQVPFRLKTVKHREMFGRADSAVLYTPRRRAQFTLELIKEIYHRIQLLLRDETPLFTLRLAPGLAFAEDPGTQESFGLCRCRILAQGLWSAYMQRARYVHERFAIVERYFRSEGILPERPWLNPDSADDIQLDAIAEVH